MKLPVFSSERLDYELLLSTCLAYSSVLKMEAVCSSEMSFESYYGTLGSLVVKALGYKPEDRGFETR
jgi:hypothetical protein